jgi:hypothetical protein
VGSACRHKGNDAGGAGAEVTTLRRAMESLAAAVVEAQPVDPTPTLEAITRRLERVETRLRSVEEQPAIRSIADRYRTRDDEGLGSAAWALAKNLLFVVAPRLSVAWQAGFSSACPC